MASTIRIKKRAASGADGAPSSLASSELAFNESDLKLYYGFGDNGSAVASSVITVGGTGAFVDKTTAQTVAGNKTFSDNVVVSGNLTVNGTTTTLASTNSVVKDGLIELGNGVSGSPANDSGIVVERGSSDNAFFGWDESEDKFTLGTGSFTGASTGNLSITTGTLVANVEGNVTGNVTGNASGSSGSCTGNAGTASALATGRTIGMTGDVSWTSSSFTGSANVTGTATIGNDKIDSQHYVDGSIDSAHLAGDVITGAKIADDAVDSEHIAADSLDTEHYAAGSVDDTALASNAVTTAKINADAVDGTKIANDSIDSEHYAAGSIDLEHMASESVDEDNLYISNAGTNGQYLQKQSGNNGGLTWATIADSTNASALTSGTLPAARIGDDSIVEAKLDIHNSPTDGYVLKYSSSNGLIWEDAGTATNASNVTASANNSTDETTYLTFVDGTTGSQGIETDSGLTYNPSSGLLTTTKVDALIDGGTF